MIELKPITLLVGRNSSGKSSFLRALPLLKQSVTTRTRSPILWWGDFVDFGSFDGAVYRNEPQREISFHFGFDQIAVPLGRYTAQSGRQVRELPSVEVVFHLHKTENVERIFKIDLQAAQGTYRATLEMDDLDHLRSVIVNGRDMSDQTSPYSIELDHGSLLPYFTVYERSAGSQSPTNYQSLRHSIFHHTTFTVLKGCLHGNTSNARVSQVAQLVHSLWPLDVQRIQQMLTSSSVSAQPPFTPHLRGNFPLF